MDEKQYLARKRWLDEVSDPFDDIQRCLDDEASSIFWVTPPALPAAIPAPPAAGEGDAAQAKTLNSHEYAVLNF